MFELTDQAFALVQPLLPPIAGAASPGATTARSSAESCGSSTPAGHAGQGRVVDLEVIGLQHSAVDQHPVALGEQRRQCPGGPLGPVFLHEAEGAVDQHTAMIAQPSWDIWPTRASTRRDPEQQHEEGAGAGRTGVGGWARGLGGAGSDRPAPAARPPPGVRGRRRPRPALPARPRWEAWPAAAATPRRGSRSGRVVRRRTISALRCGGW